MATTTETSTIKKLRSPICSVMGHVDSGKTTLLDTIRKTHIVDKEAGGITQGISANEIALSSIIKATSRISGKFDVENAADKLPGILFIDTPGHEAFTDLRGLGTKLCDVAIVTIDAEEGLQPQTIESIELLKQQKTPFIIVMTKIDRIYGWDTQQDLDLKTSFKRQSKTAQNTLLGYIEGIKSELKDKFKIRSEFYVKNKKPDKVYSIVAVNSRMNEGVADLLALIVYISTNWMTKRLGYSEDKLEATVMETHFEKSIGWTTQIILANGKICAGDDLFVIQRSGVKQIRVRNSIKDHSYLDHVGASACIKLVATGLEGTVPGTHLHQNLAEAQHEYNSLDLGKIHNQHGVTLIVPNVGSAHACQYLLKQRRERTEERKTKEKEHEIDIQFREIQIGPIGKKQLDRLEHLVASDQIQDKFILDYSQTGLLDREAKQHAVKLGFIYLHDPVVYRLFDAYTDLIIKMLDDRTAEHIKTGDVIYPVKLQILKEYVFMHGGGKKKEIVCGVKVLDGRLNKHMPLCFIGKDGRVKNFGQVQSIQHDNKEINDEVKKGREVCIKIENPEHFVYERQFNSDTLLYSYVTRKSIDVLKESFRDEMKDQDWLLLIEIKQVMGL